MKHELDDRFNPPLTSVKPIQTINEEPNLLNLEHFNLLDINKALVHLGNDAHLLRKALHSIVKEEIPRDLVDIKNAYAAADWHAIEKRAHRLKSGLIYCGVIRLAYACQYFERYYANDQASLLEPLYQQLLVVIEETTQAINEWLNNSSAGDAKNLVKG